MKATTAKTIRKSLINIIPFGLAIAVYAITSLFYTYSEKSIMSKKTIFRFDLSTSMVAAEVGPGDSFAVRPMIYNDATEDMYVFMQIDMPVGTDGLIYIFDLDSDWQLVSNDSGTLVYSYSNTDMTVLCPGDSTTPLTEQMTMKEMTNAEYALIDDINITITGYAIGTDDVSTNPIDAWNECKMIADSQ